MFVLEDGRGIVKDNQKYGSRLVWVLNPAQAKELAKKDEKHQYPISLFGAFKTHIWNAEKRIEKAFHDKVLNQHGLEFDGTINYNSRAV